MKSKKKALILVYILIAIFMVSCKTSNQAVHLKRIKRSLTNESFKFVKEKSITLKLDGFIRASFVNDVTNDEVTLSVYNKKGPCLVRVNLTTEELRNWKLSEGQGPDEFVNPKVINIGEDAIYIMDEKNPKINQLNNLFALINSTRIKDMSDINQVHDWGFKGKIYHNECMVITSKFQNISRGTVSLNGIELISASIFDLEKGHFSDPIYSHTIKWQRGNSDKYYYFETLPLDAAMIEPYAFILDMFDYKVVRYDMNTGEIIGVEVEFEKKKFTESEVINWTKSHDLLSKSFRLKQSWVFSRELIPALFVMPFDNGILVGTCQDYNESKDEWIICDYFDFQLNHLGLVKIPPYEHSNAGGLSAGYAANNNLYKNRRLYQLKTNEDSGELTIDVWSINSAL